MKAQVFRDEAELFLNPFITTLTANLIDAIASSLKCPRGNHIEFHMKGEILDLFVDGLEIPMDLGQAQKICNRLFSGLLASLRGAEGGKEYRFVLDR